MMALSNPLQCPRCGLNLMQQVEDLAPTDVPSTLHEMKSELDIDREVDAGMLKIQEYLKGW
jgi:hypothetical protein